MPHPSTTILPQLARLPPHVQFMIRLYARGDEQLIAAVALFMDADSPSRYTDRQIALTIKGHERTVRRWRSEWAKVRDGARAAMLALGYTDREMTALPEAEVIEGVEP